MVSRQIRNEHASQRAAVYVNQLKERGRATLVRNATSFAQLRLCARRWRGRQETRIERSSARARGGFLRGWIYSSRMVMSC